MTAESMQSKNQAAALNDTDLNEVTGGYEYIEVASSGRYYHWTGASHSDSKYLCPNCKRPVHRGSWSRYYCDPCDASWYNESPLIPNFSSNSWQEISEAEYEKACSANRLAR